MLGFPLMDAGGALRKTIVWWHGGPRHHPEVGLGEKMEEGNLEKVPLFGQLLKGVYRKGK